MSTRWSKAAWITAGAVGLWLGFPNALGHVPPLALLYPAALVILGNLSATRGEAFRLGWLSGLAGASAALYWLALPVHDVGGLPWPLAAPCAAAIGAYVGLYAGVFCCCAHMLRARALLGRCLSLGIIWYLLEFLRGTLFTGFPWLSLATAFAPWPWALQGAWLTGGYALGGILATAACLLVVPRRAAIGAGMALLLALGGFGAWRMQQSPPSDAKTADAFPVILVEGNVDQNQKWEPALQQSMVDLYVNLSRDALRNQQKTPGINAIPPLVIWPETAMPFYFQSHPTLGPQVRDFVKTEHVPLLLGAPGVIRETRDSFFIFNRAYLLSANGINEGWYDKTHLVPFGEFLPPWLAFDFLKPLLQGVGDFTPGRAAAPLRTGNLALGLLICYESIFPEIARQRVADGANVLVNISNDGWFSDSAAPEQHLQLAVLRAVEQDRWLVRGTNTGISAIVDNRGRLVLRGAQFREQALHGSARLRETHSPYFYLEPWLPGMATVLLLALLLFPAHATLRPAPQRRQPSTNP